VSHLRVRGDGPKFDAHGERAFGPILFTQYTLSRRVLKLTAQMAPVGAAEAQQVRLLVRARGGAGAWREAGAEDRSDGSHRTFRLSDWDDERDHEYRVSYDSRTRRQAHSGGFDGTIRRDPRDKTRTVVAAFTGNNDLGSRTPTS